MAQGRAADAVECFEPVLTLEPRNAALRTHLALMQREAGDLQGAIANFEQALADASPAEIDTVRIDLALTLTTRATTHAPSR